MTVLRHPAPALRLQPGVELLQAGKARPRLEDVVAREADLVLDLPFLPARGRRAGDRLDQVVRAELQEAPVEGPLLAPEHRVHRRAHVVVDATPARAAEE